MRSYMEWIASDAMLCKIQRVGGNLASKKRLSFRRKREPRSLKVKEWYDSRACVCRTVFAASVATFAAKLLGSRFRGNDTFFLWPRSYKRGEDVCKKACAIRST